MGFGSLSGGQDIGTRKSSVSLPPSELVVGAEVWSERCPFGWGGPEDRGAGQGHGSLVAELRCRFGSRAYGVAGGGVVGDSGAGRESARPRQQTPPPDAQEPGRRDEARVLDRRAGLAPEGLMHMLAILLPRAIFWTATTLGAAAPSQNGIRPTVRTERETYRDGSPRLEQQMRELSKGSWVADGASTAWYPNGRKDYQGVWREGKKSGPRRLDLLVFRCPEEVRRQLRRGSSERHLVLLESGWFREAEVRVRRRPDRSSLELSPFSRSSRPAPRRAGDAHAHSEPDEVPEPGAGPPGQRAGVPVAGDRLPHHWCPRARSRASRSRRSPSSSRGDTLSGYEGGCVRPRPGENRAHGYPHC